MNATIIDVTLAGISFPCALRYPETAGYFHTPSPGATPARGEPVCLSDDDWRCFLSGNMVEGPYSEYSILSAAFSDALLSYDRMVIHGVALRWRDRAYLICAPSGTGKSTQARCLQELRPGAFGVICGDRPVLRFRSSEPVPARDSSAPIFPEGYGFPKSSPSSNKLLQQATDEVIVHPSPWNGKENWHGAEAAPLAGLILLCRGEKNTICSLSPREAAVQTYTHIIQRCESPEKLRKAAELATRLLRSVPIWQLSSYQVPDSTKLLLESVFQ